MFEEDYERCFICQQACKGLYCSSECRQQDKGTPSPAVRPVGAVRVGAHLPQGSPLLRLSTESPSNADTSSTSSMSSSPPLHSPATYPSTAGDSPQKELFDLPPLAFPSQGMMHSPVPFPGSMPVKIPALVPRIAPSVTPGSHVHTPAAHTPGSHTPTAFPGGASIDTLRFGRKPGLTNTLTSPSALVARCACGKPANHRGRALSKDRGLESGFVSLNLGPSLTSHEHVPRKSRIVSESAASPDEPKTALISQPRHSEPQLDHLFSGSSMHLARSRSDPIPPSSPKVRAPVAPIRPTVNRGPASVRISHLENNPLFSPESAIAPSFAASPGRGRSRERQIHAEIDPGVPGVTGILNHPPEREHPPSRSRNRREERDHRETRRANSTAAPEPPQITPSWSRPPADAYAGVAPAMRRTCSGGQKMPEIADERRREEIRRATNQLNGLFGVAAG